MIIDLLKLLTNAYKQKNLFIVSENLALNKSTWQKHPWPDPNRDFGSENAVDGLYTDRGIRGQCTINADGYYTAEWRVDLGSVVRISHINIFYRTDNQSMAFVITCSFIKSIKSVHCRCTTESYSTY